jgi:hypothetical protein
MFKGVKEPSSNLKEKISATNVTTVLERISDYDWGSLTVLEMKKSLGASLANLVLDSLPERVSRFDHSEHDYVNATRDGDGETWDENKAGNWANEILD